MVTVWEYTPGEVFLSLLWIFLFFVWAMLLVSVFVDIFRSADLSGWGKALWTAFVIVLPYLGVFVYLIVRGRKMGEHAIRDAARREEETRAYVRGIAGTPSTADEIERLAALRSDGALTDVEFERAKAALLA